VAGAGPGHFRLYGDRYWDAREAQARGWDEGAFVESDDARQAYSSVTRRSRGE
jgi:hypothetical protein